MVSVSFYFQVHQPYRIKDFSVFNIGEGHEYFSDKSERSINNEKVLRKVAEKCYLPTNKVILELIKKYPQFKASYSFSGVVLDQFEEFYPKVIESFKELTDTGNVEVLDETYYHSLSFLYSKKEFREQVLKHRAKVKEIFKVAPTTFRNTELIYNNALAKEVEDMGYKAILAEGHDYHLGWRSPNFVYKPKGTDKIKLLLKNYRLSDDIAFRFSERSWKEWPLTADKYTNWINAVNGNGHSVNLFMDYETFGEHQWESTGIFDFLKALPEYILKHPDNNFKTPSEVADSYPVMGELDIHNFISWADVERDLGAWLSNPMQKSAIESLYKLEPEVMATDNKDIIHTWRKLQTSDHFYYMCTKWFSDGDVHKYFNPYESPYEAFINFMNVLTDLKLKIKDLNARKEEIVSIRE